MKEYGFSLTELMVVLTLIAIVMSYAIPPALGMYEKHQAYRVISTVQSIVDKARVTAATSHQTITLCGSSLNLGCNNHWSEGILVFTDINHNGSLDNNESVLVYESFDITPAHLKWNGFSGKILTMEGTGIPFASNGTFTYCNKDNNPLYSRQVIVNRGGRSRHSRDSNNDGFHEDSLGNIISC